jgi:hypothetical protein
MAQELSPSSSSRARAWTAVAVGLAGVLTMPAAVVVARQSKQVAVLDSAYGVPVAFVLGILALGMARRAKRNLEWFRLDNRGSGAASAGVILGVLAVSLALTAALSVFFYEAVLFYQRHYR